MNNKYNSLKEQLSSIKNRCSSVFEDSLLYQIEKIDFFKHVDKLLDEYEFIRDILKNIHQKFSEKNFPNIFLKLTAINNKIYSYDTELNEFKEKLQESTAITYDNFRLEFNNYISSANNYLSNAKKYLDNYNRYSYTLSSLMETDPNYYNIKTKKEIAKNNFYLKINKLPTILENLEILLKKGLEKI